MPLLKPFTLLLLFSGLYLSPGHSLAQTLIPDSTDISGIWTAANSPYIIEGRAIVPFGQSLQIEEGVEIRLKSSASPTPAWFDYSAGNLGVIRVQGTIQARGTANNPIRFTRNNSGFWGVVLIDENAADSCSFSHCLFEYAHETRNVEGISSPISFDGALSLYKKAVRVQDNQFRDNNRNGLYLRSLSDTLRLVRNYFYDNGANGSVFDQSTVVASNNFYYNNSIRSTGQVSAIRSSNSELYLVGNLIYNNDDFGVFCFGGGNNYLINNTIFGNSQGIRVENGAHTFIYNCIVQGNGLNFASASPGGANITMQHSLSDELSFPANVSDMGGNLLSTNALFVNANSEDFRLQALSPAIDAGRYPLPVFSIPGLDILGQTRISNDSIDIGAIEFQNSLSLEGTALGTAVQVYPNPSAGKIHILADQKFGAQVYSLGGNLLGSYDTTGLDLSHLAAGTYILRLISREGAVFHRLILLEDCF